MADPMIPFFDEPATPSRAGGNSPGFSERLEPFADAAPAYEDTIVTRSGVTLGAPERAVMNALAAYQLRYGKANEALAILQVVNRLWPEDVQTLRLLTQGFLVAEDYEAAEMTQQALLRRSGRAKPSRADQIRKAILDFGRGRIAEARALMMKTLAEGPAGVSQEPLSSEPRASDPSAFDADAPDSEDERA